MSSTPLFIPLIFMLKRLLIAFATVTFNPQHNQLLVSTYVFVQVVSLSFVISEKPMNQLFLNIVEGLNETFILITAYHLILFTDFVPEVATRNDLGDYFIYIIYTFILLNLVVIIGQAVKSLIKFVWLRWQRRQAEIQSNRKLRSIQEQKDRIQAQ